MFQPQLNYICTCRKSSYLKPQREKKKQLLELQQLGPISKATIRRTLRNKVLRFAFTTILFPQPLAFLCRCQTHPQQPAPSPHHQRIPWLNVPGPDTVVPNGWSNVYVTWASNTAGGSCYRWRREDADDVLPWWLHDNTTKTNWYCLASWIATLESKKTQPKNSGHVTKHLRFSGHSVWGVENERFQTRSKHLATALGSAGSFCQ